MHFAVAVSALAALASPACAGGQKVVIELFTSQGCSSCPAADKLLGEFADSGKYLALSLPVDYWDYLGWHDTLAKSVNSQRQRGYSEARGGHEVFTPQVIVNGMTPVIGNDRSKIEAAAKEAAKEKMVPVTIRKNGEKLEVEVGAGSGGPAGIWLFCVSRQNPVEITRGENRGKTIDYRNVVRDFWKLADWNGTQVKSSVPLKEIFEDKADMVAVVVQSGTTEKPGLIKGAAAINLP